MEYAEDDRCTVVAWTIADMWEILKTGTSMAMECKLFATADGAWTYYRVTCEGNRGTV